MVSHHLSKVKLVYCEDYILKKRNKQKIETFARIVDEAISNYDEDHLLNLDTFG